MLASMVATGIGGQSMLGTSRKRWFPDDGSEWDSIRFDWKEAIVI